MTTPDVRTRAVLATAKFLEDLCAGRHVRVPKAVRLVALGLLRHYPEKRHLDKAAEAWPSFWTAPHPDDATGPSYLELLRRLHALEPRRDVQSDERLGEE